MKTQKRKQLILPGNGRQRFAEEVRLIERGSVRYITPPFPSHRSCKKDHRPKPTAHLFSGLPERCPELAGGLRVQVPFVTDNEAQSLGDVLPHVWGCTGAGAKLWGGSLCSPALNEALEISGFGGHLKV